MLNFCTCINALHQMKISYEALAGNFDTSTGTIDNWIKGKVKYPKVAFQKLEAGFEGCRQTLEKTYDEFIYDLIDQLNISLKEKGILQNEYRQKGYNAFITYLLKEATNKDTKVPLTRTYDFTSVIRPVIGVGQDHAIAVLHNGKVRSCGDNTDQQCNTHSWHDVVAVTGCWKASIGLCANGTVVASGTNVIEDGTLFRWTDIESITSGTFHVLGLKSDKTVISFGRNPYGQCDVTGWSDIIAIAAGENHSVGLRSDGSVVAAGNNLHGQCEVENWTNVIQIAAAANHTLALLSDGTVIGCGNLGTIKTDALFGATAIATGTMHAVGLMVNGSVVNTGADVCGLCDVERWHDMVAVSAGFSSTIGVRSDGRVFVTQDKHKPYHLDTQAWKLFDNKQASVSISQFDAVITDLKHKLEGLKQQALKVCPYINQYHDNVKILDFSDFHPEYQELKKQAAEIYRIYENNRSKPTIENLTSVFLTAFMEMDNTIEVREGLFFITKETYDTLSNLFFTIDQLQPEIRMVESGATFTELTNKQVSDFTPISAQTPSWD